MTPYRRHELARVLSRTQARISLAAGLDAREQALAATAVAALGDLADALDRERQAEPAGQLDLDLRTRHRTEARMTSTSHTFDRAVAPSSRPWRAPLPAGVLPGMSAGGQARTLSTPTTSVPGEAARSAGVSAARHSRPTPAPNGTGASGGTRAERNR